MCQKMPDQWELFLAKIKKRHVADQSDLISFLEQDLELGLTFLRFLEESESMTEERAAALSDKVQAVVDVIRRLEGHIQDPREWQRIHERTDELESRLARVFGKRPGVESQGRSAGADGGRTEE